VHYLYPNMHYLYPNMLSLNIVVEAHVDTRQHALHKLELSCLKMHNRPSKQPGPSLLASIGLELGSPSPQGYFWVFYGYFNWFFWALSRWILKYFSKQWEKHRERRSNKDKQSSHRFGGTMKSNWSHTCFIY